MAGVVAMASVIEDFDTQPCKKSRKDVKTITNYFSPVPKPAEKPFSPPRSSNIMDYFSRKTPSSKEKSSPPQDLKENCQKPQPEEKRTNADTGKKPSEKRGRKTSRAARKLVPTEAVGSTDDCLIVEETQQSKDSTSDAAGSQGTLGSDTAVLLSKLSAETRESGVSGICKTVSDERMERHFPQENVPKCEESDELEPTRNTTAISPRAEVKQVKKAVRKPMKRQQKESKHPEPEEKVAERSLCDVSTDVSLDETSKLNSSTVTISFEDFVRSRSQNEIKEDLSEEDDGKNTEKAEELNHEQLDVPKTEGNVGPVQVSPRTLTIQAEVHAVSPKQETVKAAGKLASIFTRRRGAVSSAGSAASPPADDERQLSSPFSTIKRRSNVVLQEEDLELAVIESESTPKCSETERKQFMAAFKQPCLDGSKAKPVKSQSKQKPAEEKTVEAAEDGDLLVLSVEQDSQDSKASKKKSVKKERDKAKDKQEAVHTSPAASAVEETEITAVEAEDEKEEPSISSTPTVPALRRSKRETVVRKSPEKAPTTPVRKTRRQKESKEPVNAVNPQVSPAKMSTPKTRRSRHGFFVAQMLCPPDANESPIRIRLSRVHKKVAASKTESGNDITTSSNNKILNESKKRQQAKKLVEKAKMIQQSKKTTEKESLRRSSRMKTSMKKSYYEDENSVVCIEDLTATPQSTPRKSKTQKTLRSLNEVLGKAVPPGKATPGSKAASLGQDKSGRKVSAVISIFDDSSCEGSENSQDDEQFRARREFLKSGLPESFRKQIAKTAATKEAYSASSSSFQPVSHTTQPPNDCSLWSLPWPESSLLGHLKDLWNHTPNPLPSISGSLCVKTEPACRKAYEKGSVWRPEISESDRQLLMKEFCSKNPHFPAQTVFTRLQKRRADHQQQLTASEPEAVTIEDSCALLPDETVGGKRKRKEDERENNVKVAKKQKSSHSEQNISPAEPPRRGGRTRPAQRSRMKEDEMKEKTKLTLKSAPDPSEDESVVVVDDLTLEADTGGKESVKEELLWTDKYQPQLSADIIDNTPAVKRLYSWLKDWKLRADRDERKNQKDKKQAEGSCDSEWDCGDADYQDAEDTLCNTVLITGPTGVGKTAAVYACAQELGFKVFEVNASSQRSGRLILSQLKEATQSHQVDSQGVNAHKHPYFNSCGLSSNTSSVRPGSSPRKVNSPCRVVSSPRKNPQSPRGAKKGGLAPTSLAKFFKMGQPSSKEPQKPDQTAPSKKTTKANESSDKNKAPATSTPKEKSSEEQSKKTATSLILFEEVDVIFDDDSGFLAAIKTFMSTTKRPVILTTSDPAFSATFDGSFEEINFKKPSVVNVGSYLQLLCLAENMRTHPLDVSSLLKLNGCDVRQSLLQLQFWAQSAGGHLSTRPLVQTGQNETVMKPENKEAAEKSVTDASSLPPCDTGCTESKLGLLNIEPHRDIWELLRSRSLMEATVSLELLTDSKRRGVDLLYCNMENLLPLPLTQLSTSKLCLSESQDLRFVSPKQQLSSSSLQSDTLSPGVDLLQAAESADLSDSCSPVKVSNRMKKSKKRHHLPTRDVLNSDSDSEDGFPPLCKKQNEPQTEQVKERAVYERVKRRPLTAEEQVKSVPVSQGLQSIADFWDNMSYVDSSLLFRPDGFNNYRRSSFSAVIKAGMTDESSIETRRESWSTGSSVLEIQAAVEALSFHECRASVAEAWDKVQQLEGDLRKEAVEELTLPVATHREDYSFSQDGLSHPQLAQQRKEVMKSLFFKVFGTLGNRQAVALDYLPTMRTICRSEQLKEQGKVKRRFLHYLDAIHLGVEKSTLQFLAEDFP